MLEFLGQVGHAILTPLYYAVSSILVAFHWLFSLVLNPDSGWSWALSIVGLTLVIRMLLIPLFVKQIKNSRSMQLLQPKVKALQTKYGHDREGWPRRPMKLYKETGTNPFSAASRCCCSRRSSSRCSAAQRGRRGPDPRCPHPGSGPFACQRRDLRRPDLRLVPPGRLATLQVVDHADACDDGDDVPHTAAADGEEPAPGGAEPGRTRSSRAASLRVAARVRGRWHRFPIGVLLYWTTSNLWTMGQQLYVIRNDPAAGTASPLQDGSPTTARRRTRRLPGVATASVVDAPMPRR